MEAFQFGERGDWSIDPDRFPLIIVVVTAEGKSPSLVGLGARTGVNEIDPGDASFDRPAFVSVVAAPIERAAANDGRLPSESSSFFRVRRQ